MECRRVEEHESALTCSSFSLNRSLPTRSLTVIAHLEPRARISWLVEGEGDLHGPWRGSAVADTTLRWSRPHFGASDEEAMPLRVLPLRGLGGGVPLELTHWCDLGQWFDDLARVGAMGGSVVAREALAATDSGAAPSAAADAIYSRIQSSFRYLADERGIGGYRPDTAAAVVKREYGDCKELAAAPRPAATVESGAGGPGIRDRSLRDRTSCEPAADRRARRSRSARSCRVRRNRRP